MKKFLSHLVILTIFLSLNPAYACSCKGPACNSIMPPSAEANLSVALQQPPSSIDNLVGNFNNKIEIVFSDVDGTLLPLDKSIPKGTVPEGVKKAAQKLKNAKIPFVVTTGRSSGEAKIIAQRISPDNMYIISQQGAEIKDPSGKFLYQDLIKDEDVKKIINEIEDFKKLNHIDSKVFFFVNGKPYSTQKFQMAYCFEKVKVVKSVEKAEQNGSLKCCKVGVYEPNTKALKLVQAHLKTKFPNYHIDLSADCYCDISNLTASKGNAVKKLAQILGIDLKNAAVFGDAENDISMLANVKNAGGLAVAVDNAMPTLKQNANYVTKSVTQDGFGYAVDEIIKNNANLSRTKP